MTAISSDLDSQDWRYLEVAPAPPNPDLPLYLGPISGTIPRVPQETEVPGNRGRLYLAISLPQDLLLQSRLQKGNGLQCEGSDLYNCGDDGLLLFRRRWPTLYQVVSSVEE